MDAMLDSFSGVWVSHGARSRSAARRRSGCKLGAIQWIAAPTRREVPGSHRRTRAAACRKFPQPADRAYSSRTPGYWTLHPRARARRRRVAASGKELPGRLAAPTPSGVRANAWVRRSRTTWGGRLSITGGRQRALVTH